MKKRKINIQKIFCFVSFIFLATCVFWYGGRFIYFYLDNNKTQIETEDTLVQTILNENEEKDTLKNTNEEHYFYKSVDNNYVMYSNILWRVIKINSSKEVVLITDSPITNLAYGEAEDYDNSDIQKWLTNILENDLNKKEDYLTKNNTCIDTIDEIEKSTCKKTNNDNYIGLLSLVDYINTGASDSFINNEKYTYLSNNNSDNEIWYLNNNGKVSTTTTDQIYGIKPVITLSSSVKTIKGNGTKDNPYEIETETGLFGSYVKLDDDIWRIYQINDNQVKLVLNDYLKINNEEITHSYSNNNYYHNDTKYGSLAYYLNNTYLNSLSYKDIIDTDYWSNNYYELDYSKVLEKTIDTKVSILSIGDVILNNELDNYFTNTGISKTSDEVYVVNNNGTLKEKNVTDEFKIVPCISIKKDLLTKGSGTKDNPYEME